MSQPDFLYELFEDFMDDPANQDFSMDNGLVCRWMTGQAKISPKISAYYSKPSNQKKLAETIHQNLLPLMSDCNMAMPCKKSIHLHKLLALLLQFVSQKCCEHSPAVI